MIGAHENKSPTLARTALRIGTYDLTPLSPADTVDLVALFGDLRVTEYMDIDPIRTQAEALEIIGWAMELAERDEGVRWAIRSQGVLIGTVGFNRLERDRGRRGEIAYDLAHMHWGQGVMSQILPAVIGFGFQTLHLRRIEAMVTVGNQRSCKLLERHGFAREGCLRDHGYWKGQFWDQLVYGRLAD